MPATYSSAPSAAHSVVLERSAASVQRRGHLLAHARAVGAVDDLAARVEDVDAADQPVARLLARAAARSCVPSSHELHADAASEAWTLFSMPRPITSTRDFTMPPIVLLYLK